jgi:hypothetical protein
MARPLTQDEKTFYQGVFPNLDVDAARVSGDATTDYNCLAWTLGITDRKVWPGPTEDDFDRLYTGAGFVRDAASGPIAAWGFATDNMTHGSTTGPGHGSRWESKCGDMHRLQHGRDELQAPIMVPNSYGYIRYYYRMPPPVVAFLLRLFRPRPRAPALQLLSPAEQQALAQRLRDVPPDLRAAFEAAYARWRDGWSAPEVRLSSDPAVVQRLPGYDDLIGLGVDVVPLLVGKLADPREHLALQAYDRLAEAPLSPGTLPVQDLLGGEEHRALLSVRDWLARPPAATRRG